MKSVSEKPPPKVNLVLVNAFLTNSVVLKGLIDYLSHYFQVHFIDLPGFSRAIPPLPEITLDSFARYVEDRIASLNLDRYLLGGISFGFAVVSRVNADGNCRSMVGIAPYINSRWLNLGLLKKTAYSFLVDLTIVFNLSARLWRHRRFHQIFNWYSDYPPERIKTLLDQMEGRTFFETARIILRHRGACQFHRKPYALILSQADRTIKNAPLLRLFEEQVERLKILQVDIDHYPLDISEDYFHRRLPAEKVEEILHFFQ